VKTAYEWDWAGAEWEYQRAIELNPNYGTAHAWYAMHLGAMGRLEDALREVKRARDVEPLSAIINANVAWYYWVGHQYDQAIEESRRAIALDADFAWNHNDLGSVLLQTGRYAEAIAEFQQGAVLSGRGVLELTFLANAYPLSGQTPAAQKLLDQLIERPQGKVVSPQLIATVYVGLGDKQRALTWLE
jgi:tetratricopeptide (TPR) repeat protein